jgi:hypothetical protein
LTAELREKTLGDEEKKAAEENLASRITEVLAPTAETQEQIRRAMEPLLKFSQEYNNLSKRINSVFAENREQIARFMNGAEEIRKGFLQFAERVSETLPSQDVLEHWSRAIAQLERLEDVGFLPHSTMRSLMENENLDGAALSDAIEAHFREHWSEIEALFRKDIDGFDVDDEAKQTFREALAAHGNGHYRAVCRLLFPEFERIARDEIHNGELNGIGSQPGLKEFVDALGLSTVSKLGGLRVLPLMEVLLDHLYLNVRKPAQVEKFRNDPIPNRHACLHGILVYNTAKNSINMLIMADFIYRIVGILKQSRDGSPK